MTPLFKNVLDVKPTRELYEKAADLIEKNGLAKGCYVSGGWSNATDQSCFCMVGALCYVAGGGIIGVDSLEGIVTKPLGHPADAICFSDRHSQAEVVAQLRRIAVKLGQLESKS